MLPEDLESTPFPIIDTHAHYDDAAFDGCRDELLRQIYGYGVKKIINASVDLDYSAENCLSLSRKYPFCLTAIGVHPETVEAGGTLDEQRLVDLCREPSVVAVGEIGLDYHYSDDKKAEQRDVFKRQCEIANELSLPVVIHDRDAHGDTFEIVNKIRPKGVIHCFSGSVESALEYCRLGMYIGIGGVITFKNARKAVEVAAAVPMENILLETDAPYLAPVPYRGSLCNSAFIIKAAERIAEIKCIPVETVLRTAALNAARLFGDALKLN